MKRNAVAWAALVVSSAALVSSQGLLRPLPAAPKVSSEDQKTAHSLSAAYEAVAEFVKPSVVQISVKSKVPSFAVNPNRRRAPNGPQGLDPKSDPNQSLEDKLKEFFGPELRPRPSMGTGSGFVFDDRGHILTNYHVVNNADKITVTFHDGVEAPATVVGTDPQSDVDVIKVDRTNYRPLPLGQSSKLKVGALVMAVGSPFGLSESVTTGIISATDRNSVGINEFESFLQTDAAINPGNSGGPLVNMDGQVVGVNAVIMTGARMVSSSAGNDGVGLAIPIDMASTVAENLIKHGKVQRSRVGIMLSPLTPALGHQFGIDPKVKGVVVGDIVKGSPAEKAGLQPGDVITGFNGAPVVSLPTFRLNVSASKSGQEFGLTYLRDGKEHKGTIVPAPYEQVAFQEEKPAETTKEEKSKAVVSSFGFEVQPLTDELASELGYKKDFKGLLISEVKEDSPADRAGLKTGEVILRVVKERKTQAVASVEAFKGLTDKADEVALYVASPNRPNRFVTLSKASSE